MEITVTANVVAWYAAIVATAGALIQGYNVWRNRTRLRVSARPNMKLVDSGGPYSADDTYIIIDVANIGRRPVRLRKLPWFTVKGDDSFVVKGNWEPSAKLTEGESASMLCRQDSLDVELCDLQKVFVKDVVGRKWKGDLESND